MGKSQTNIPSGTRDFGPEEMSKRLYILNTIRDVYNKYGFQPLETPAMENLSVLMGKYGEEGDRLLYRILNSGDFLRKVKPEERQESAQELTPKIAEKGLRYDLTVPFARYVVMNRGTLVFPFRRYQIQPVWRADRPQKGRYREFYQCDADVVGTDSLVCEAEIVGMLNEVFKRLGIENFTIKINNRKILAGITEAVGANGKETDFCTAIDKLDKIGLEKVNQELKEREFSDQAIDELQPILNLEGSNRDKINALHDIIGFVNDGRKGLEEIEQVFDLIKHMGLEEAPVEFDLTLARGLTYYTGAIFEVKVNDVSIGSVSGGGRYDNLTGVFGWEGMSGVGISFGVDRLYDVMEELDLFPTEKLGGTTLLFVSFDEQSHRYCLPLLQQVRAAGVHAEIFPDPVKMKKQMNYANRKNIPFVALAGSEEVANQRLTLKNMATGAQESLTIDEVIASIKATD